VRTSEIPEAQSNSAEGCLRFAETLNRWGKRLQERGLKLVTHFHSYQFKNFGGKGTGTDIIIDGTDPGSVFFMPDLFWLTAAGVEASRYLLRFKGRSFMLHVNDYSVRPQSAAREKVPVSDAPIGAGNMNWPAVMAAAREVGIEEFVVELEDSGAKVFDDLEISYSRLKEWIGVYYT